MRGLNKVIETIIKLIIPFEVIKKTRQISIEDLKNCANCVNADISKLEEGWGVKCEHCSREHMNLSTNDVYPNDICSNWRHIFKVKSDM